MGKASHLAVPTSRSVPLLAAGPRSASPSVRSVPLTGFQATTARLRDEDVAPALPAGARDDEVGGRRSVLLGAAGAAMMTAFAPYAKAEKEKSTSQKSNEKALVADSTQSLLKAKFVLQELETLAKQKKSGKEVKPARGKLVKCAAILDDVEYVLPVVIDCAYGGMPDDRPECMGEKKYTLKDGPAVTDAILSSIGKILKESKKSIRDEAFEQGALATAALSDIDKILNQMPSIFMSSQESLAEMTAPSLLG